jgi:Short C-terminal domain
VTSGKKILTRTFNVTGVGTHLGSAAVNHGAAEKIEAWFRAHPQFGANTGRANGGEPPQQPSSPSGLIADELRKLADLHKEGVLTDEEFAAQKAHLLSS